MLRVASSRPFEAISAVVDLEGFSEFCAMPDNHARLASYLNFVFDLIEESLAAKNLLTSLRHWKFIGDGAIFIWPLDDSQDLGDRVFFAFHNLFRTYPAAITHEAEDLNLREAPRRIRVGIAQGEIRELKASHGSEYVGFSINLASRLQSYCRSIGFLVSSSMSLTDKTKDEYPLLKARTRKRPGMQTVDEEIRYVPEDASHLSARDLCRWLDHDVNDTGIKKVPKRASRLRAKAFQNHHGGLPMDPITIISTISAGLNLIDKFRSLSLKLMEKTGGTPSVHAEAKDGVMEIKRQGHVVEHVDESKLDMNAWDQSRYRALEKKVKANWQIFNDIDAEMPTASSDEKARLRQRLQNIKGELCRDFREMLDIYEQTLGTTLADHYSLYSVCGALEDHL